MPFRSHIVKSIAKGIGNEKNIHVIDGHVPFCYYGLLY